MNLLVFNRNEVSGVGRLSLSGERAKHIREVKRLKEGDLLSIGELEGGIGTGKILSLCVDGRVVIEVGKLEEKSPQPFLDLILALPRPQTLKKVLQLCAAMGVGKLAIIRSDKVEKSYFSSPLLGEENFKEHLLLGLEQGCSTKMPQVSIHRHFKSFVENELPCLAPAGQTQSLIAHPGCSQNLVDLQGSKQLSFKASSVLAVGPEGGWTDREIAVFESCGFIPFTCGPRILRVENAVCSLLGQLELLKMMEFDGRFAEKR